jgi:hypothetical protein
LLRILCKCPGDICKEEQGATKGRFYAAKSFAIGSADCLKNSNNGGSHANCL